MSIIVKEPPTPGTVKLKSTNQAGSVNTPDHLAEYQVSRQQYMYCNTVKISKLLWNAQPVECTYVW